MIQLYDYMKVKLSNSLILDLEPKTLISYLSYCRQIYSVLVGIHGLLILNHEQPNKKRTFLVSASVFILSNNIVLKKWCGFLGPHIQIPPQMG